jgi:hypothetical protein
VKETSRWLSSRAHVSHLKSIIIIYSDTRSIFQVLAPRCLVASNGPGKIQFKHSKVKAANFSFTRGQNLLKTYYVTPKQDAGKNKHGAFCFCSRCGVHILFARTQNSRTVEINVQCLSGKHTKVKLVSKKDSLAGETVAEQGQWDEQLNSISEDAGDWTSFPRRADELSLPSIKSRGTSFDTHYSRYTSPARLLTEDDHEISFFTESSDLIEDSASNAGVPVSAGLMKRNPITLAPVTKPGTRARDITSPQFREQMRSYMKKHISSSATASTVTSSSSSAALGNDDSETS